MKIKAFTDKEKLYAIHKWTAELLAESNDHLLTVVDLIAVTRNADNGKVRRRMNEALRFRLKAEMIWTFANDLLDASREPKKHGRKRRVNRRAPVVLGAKKKAK